MHGKKNTNLKHQQLIGSEGLKKTLQTWDKE